MHLQFTVMSVEPQDAGTCASSHKWGKSCLRLRDLRYISSQPIRNPHMIWSSSSSTVLLCLSQSLWLVPAWATLLLKSYNLMQDFQDSQFFLVEFMSNLVMARSVRAAAGTIDNAGMESSPHRHRTQAHLSPRLPPRRGTRRLETHLDSAPLYL